MSWDESCWPIICQSAFTGKAQIAYAALSEEDSKDYSKVKAAVLRTYELVPEAYRQKFRSWQKRGIQTFVEFAKQKAIKFDEWLNSEKVTEFESLRELILLEDFKNNLPRDIRTHIEEFGIDSLEGAAKAADKYVLSHKSDFVKKGSHTGGTGKREENKGSSSPSSPKKGGNGVQGVVCYGCGLEGHIKRKCPEVAKNAKPAMLVNCCSVPSAVDLDGQKRDVKQDLRADFGHYVSAGSVGLNADMKGSRRVTVLRDSGACQSCILESSLPDDFAFEGSEYVLLGGFPESVSSWPLHSMYVKCPYFSGLCKLAVVKSFPVNGVDVVIGNDLVLEREGAAQAHKLLSGVVGKVEVCSKPLSPITRSQTRREDGASDPMDLDIAIDFPVVVDGEGNASVGCKDDSFKEILSKLDKQSLITAQREDNEVSILCREADESGDIGDLSKEAYTIKNNILYRISRPIDVDSESTWYVKEQIVVPKNFRPIILKEAHENMWGSHLGIHKTCAKISKNFFWPTMKKDVSRYCKSCHECQIMGKPNQKIPKAPLYPIPAVCEPFTQIVIDVVGPLPKSGSGFQYLLTIMDRTTRFPEVIPLRSIKSSVIITHLLDFFARFGLPRELQSDRGTNFTSKVFKERMQQLGIKHVLSSPYHPESQGILERFHGTLKSALGKYAHSHPNKWDEDIPFVLFALRSAPSESLGFSPYELVYGHNVRGPLDVLKDQWEESSPNVNLLEHVTQFKEKLRTILTWARGNLGQAQIDMKERFDKKAKKRDFCVGDTVLVLIPVPGEFKAQFAGPGIVRHKVSDFNYDVELPGRRRKIQTFHINLLKPYVSRTNTIHALSIISPDEMNDFAVPEGVWRGDNSEILCNLNKYFSHLSPHQSRDLKTLIHSFPSVFKDTPGLVSCVQHNVVLKPDAKPIRQPPYRLNPQKAELVKQEVKYMLDHDLIEASDSPWSSPVVLVKKENGQHRLCFDYRKVNEVTIPDNFPLPRIEDCIDRVGRSTFITKLDLMKGYWQVPLSEEARKVSAFITPDGLFECKVMPFGMRNAASTFQRLMWLVTRDLEGCIVYLDDILIFSSDWEDHMIKLKALFQSLNDFGLVVNLSKCEFAKAQVVYLGHKVGQGKVIPKLSNIQAILSFPMPHNKKNVRQFLGLSGYYRRFVPKYSEIAAPLTDLLKDKNSFKWDTACQDSFNKLRSILSSVPILTSPDFHKDFKLMTDASDLGVGAVLMQETEGIEKPIAYFSKKLTGGQLKYSTIEKELLSLILALKHFETYVNAGPSPLKVFSDHNPLKYINKFKNKNKRLMNWSLLLQDFNITIEHVKGKDNVIAAYLSRNVQ